MNREPAQPPRLPGFSFVRHLGGGGFADVFLYHQHALNRNVAVKVLLANAATPSVQQQFNAESTLMAALSNHPNIVSIFDADIATDGRPYLIMEYCSRDNMSKRYRSGSMTVSEVLTIGVQLSGAVETAHRAGIVHRDIKPANVLTTDYGRPALTDFGISVNSGAPHNDDEVGLSIPWSPPELLSEAAPGDAHSDIYSLAATVYSMLARRSPFELPGHSNEQADLYRRIQHRAVPAVGRSDMPTSLEHVLRRGMAKLPTARYHSALQFGRALQLIENEIGDKSTQIDVLDENPVAARAELNPADDGRTRVRALLSIRPDDSASVANRPASTANLAAQTADVAADPIQLAKSRLRPRTDQPESPEVERTVLRARVIAAGTGSVVASRVPNRNPAGQRAALAARSEPADTVLGVHEPGEVPPRPRTAPAKRPQLIAGIGVAVVAVGVTAAIWIGGSEPPAPPPSDQLVQTTIPVIAEGVPAPIDLQSDSSDGSVVFSWTNPAPEPGDQYKWTRTDVEAPQAVATAETSVTIPATRACISVSLVRADSRTSAAPATKCSDQE